MTAALRYLDTLARHLDGLAEREAATIERVAAVAADSIRAGGIVHVFGCGHSQLVASDASGRASGLAAVDAMADPALSPAGGQRSARTERLAGYGEVVLDSSDLRAGELLLVVSNSGINAVPIDVAIGAAERGLVVVAVTSRHHSDAVASRHPSGRRLHEVAEVVLDTGVPAGDAALQLDDGTATGPLSTLVATAIVHAVLSRAAELLVESGDVPPVLRSQNLGGTDDPNAELTARYRDRRGGPA